MKPTSFALAFAVVAALLLAGCGSLPTAPAVPHREHLPPAGHGDH